MGHRGDRRFLRYLGTGRVRPELAEAEYKCGAAKAMSQHNLNQRWNCQPIDAVFQPIGALRDGGADCWPK
jgi:hypothetical protein